MVRKKKDDDEEEVGGLQRPDRTGRQPRFKGGKQAERDRRYGITDDDFWDWWHRKKKKELGRDREKGEIIDAYNDWKKLQNRPSVK
jgi:hypothetical protein